MKKIIVLLFIGCLSAFASVNTKACAGCHGADFSKSAMGKSKIVSDMSTQDVADALVGYKNGTYGGPMKQIMVGQVSKYSEEELKNTGIGKKSFTEKVKEASKKALEKTKAAAAVATEKTKKFFSKNTVKINYSASCINKDGSAMIVTEQFANYDDFVVEVETKKLKQCK